MEDYKRKEPLKDPDIDLTELLSREFNVEFLKARNVARRISFNDFAKNYSILEALVGEETARDIVTNGFFLDYKNKSIGEYFRLLKLASKYNPLQDKGVFYSLDSLKDNLNKSQKQPEIDLNRLDILRNRLFQLDNEHSAKYLDSLIRNGYLRVTNHEHWCRGQSDGARSYHILKKVAYFIKTAFADLSLEKPRLSINNNTITLEIDDKTRTNLEKIKWKLLKFNFRIPHLKS